MIKGNSFIKKGKKAIEDDLRREYVLSSSDETFKNLCARLKCDDKILMKYTSKLEETCSNLKKCSKCKGLENYKPCKHFKENKEKNYTTFFETPRILREASLSELINEKGRESILKYIKDFYKKKLSGEKVKGLYLCGSFGSGKSYILSALLNELSNKGFRTVNIYYPALLKKLKASFNEFNYDDILDEIMTSDILLIDDIGAENNSAWARDEVLGTILQYRMDNDLSTFFTSNFTIEELESVLSETSKGTDEIKARRIIERIKYLTIEEKLITKNKRA